MIGIKKNIGSWGRVGRFSAGLLLLWLSHIEKSFVLLFFALFVFFESLMSWCVVYQILGIDRCPIKSKKPKS
jgi:hypothetical protein